MKRISNFCAQIIDFCRPSHTHTHTHALAHADTHTHTHRKKVLKQVRDERKMEVNKRLKCYERIKMNPKPFAIPILTLINQCSQISSVSYKYSIAQF